MFSSRWLLVFKVAAASPHPLSKYLTPPCGRSENYTFPLLSYLVSRILVSSPPPPLCCNKEQPHQENRFSLVEDCSSYLCERCYPTLSLFVSSYVSIIARESSHLMLLEMPPPYGATKESFRGIPMKGGADLNPSPFELYFAHKLSPLLQ